MLDLKCMTPFQGQLGSNLINLITGIQREGECRQICQAEAQCNFYTYHDPRDQSYPATCFLLTNLQQPLSYVRYNNGFDFASHFSTGTKNCDTNSEGGCFLITAGRQTRGKSPASNLCTASLQQAFVEWHAVCILQHCL